MDAGVWYYDPIGDRLACITKGDFHAKAAFLCCEQPFCGVASAVCLMMADLKTLTATAGPDAYRLTHLEAGIAGQRISLAAEALGLGCCGIGAFYDDEVKSFLGLATPAGKRSMHWRWDIPRDGKMLLTRCGWATDGWVAGHFMRLRIRGPAPVITPPSIAPVIA